MNNIACPNCGHKNRTGAKFCIKCRHSLTDVQPQPPPAAVFPGAAAPTATSRSRWLWGGMIVALLLFIVALILFWPGDGEETDVVEATSTVGAEESDVEAGSVNEPVAEESTQEPAAVAIEAPPSTPEVANTPNPQPAPVANLLSNGNFTESWEVGWVRLIGLNATGENRTEVTTVNRGITGQGIHIIRNGPDFLQLEQTVISSPADLQFTAELQLTSSASEDGNRDGLGALMLIYRDSEQQPLGYTIWTNESVRNSQLFGVSPLPPVGNNVSRYWLDAEWQRIERDIRQEIINSLPTVNPDDVRSITVALLAIGSDVCAPAICTVDIKAADLTLSSASSVTED